MSTKTRKLLTLVMALVMMLTSFVTPAMAVSAFDKTGTRIEPLTQSVNTVAPSTDGETVSISASEPVEIMVCLDSTTAYAASGDLAAAAQQAPALLQAQAKAEQKIEAALGTEIDVTANFTLLVNGFSFVGYEWMVGKINMLSGMTAFVSPVFTLVEPETEVTPSMGISTGMVSATKAWELGYTGKGSVVAVIDTGIRETHEAFSVMPEGAKIDKEYLAQVYAQYGSLMHSGSDVESLYYNEKLPFNYDYFDYDYIPNHTASDHGTHVAGIAAGNNGVDFKGVAPDAQIVTMQVFTDTGGASFSTVAQAMEDCVYLGVDAINLSLGLANGWTDTTSVGMSTLDGIYEALQNAGVSVAVAAGNDGTTLTWTNYGDFYYSIYQGLASNYDIGTVGAPATFPGSFGVASVVNSESAGYATIGGENFYYGTASGAPVLASIAGTYELVDAGYGYVESFAGLDVAGKIVLIQRGDITFTEKCDNAAAAGAAGILMYNNAAGAFNPSVVSSIPYGKLTLEEGEAIKALMAEGNTTVTIIDGFAGKSVAMASSSSWGSTSDLRIVPDIAAPGEGITSSVGFYGDADYETWSGTSMATPHVAAGLSIIKERLREEYPNATAAEINDLAYSFAMSTAHEVNGFVRQQGAGVMDIVAALTTDVYLSVEDNARPKLELDESEDGTWTFTVTLNNIGSADHTYDVDVSAMTHSVFEYDYSGNGWKIQQETTTVKLINTAIKDVTDMILVDAPETVTVAAGTSETIEVSIACTDELLAWFEENCPSGMYLEGFVTFDEAGAEGIDLSVPYLGFVGDYDFASILDRGYYWQNATGELTYQQMYTSVANKVGFGHDQLLGINPYADMTGKTFLSDRNAISPNGDSVLDMVSYIEFTLLRNPNIVKIYVESAEGELLETLYDDIYQFSKDYYTGSWNGGDSFKFANIAFDMAAYAENETVNLVFETWLDHEGYDPSANESGRWIIPVTKDTVAPSVAVTDTGIEVVDDNYVAYVAVYADEAKTQLLAEEAIFAEERGAAATVAVDADTCYVTVADYAGNEQMYLVSGDVVAATDAEAFFHGRNVIGQMSKDYSTLEYNFEWVSFRADLPGSMTMLTDVPGSNIPADLWNEGIDIQYLSTAVNKDGVLYANTLLGIYEVDSETFEATEVVGQQEKVSFRNIAIRPGTDDMYAWCYGYINDSWDDWFCKVDLASGTFTPIFKFPTDQLSVWAFAFKNANEILVFDSWYNGLITLDMSGEIIDSLYPEGFENSMGETDLGILGYGGNLLYDDTANVAYLFSDWSWFMNNHYSWAGCVRFDLNTCEADLLVTGTAPGVVVTGTFFEDSIIPEDKLPLTDFALSEDALTLEAGVSAKVDVIKTPEDANWYNMTWSVEDESVATIKGNRKNVTISAINPGTTTVTATATDRDTGELITVQTVEVTVVLDPELQTALNVAGGSLEFVSYAPYPFVPTTDETTGRDYAVSTNSGIADSESRLVMTEKLHMGDTIAFDYFVSSETDFDFLYFYANGELIFSASGESGWCEQEFMAPMNGEYTLEWVFAKDPAVEEGTDNAGVDNVRLIPGNFCAADIFSDVKAGRYYHDAVDFMVGYGFMKGMSSTVFGTDATLTRGQLVTILYRMAGEPEVDGLDNPFTDLKAGAFYYDAVVWAANAGIVKGTADSTFAPNDELTREQLATIVYRVEGEPEVDSTALNGYTDGKDVSRFAKNAMAWAVSNGIINGTNATTLAPSGSATRAQAATILMRWLFG